jgi:hypothetical protein
MAFSAARYEKPMKNLLGFCHRSKANQMPTKAQ